MASRSTGAKTLSRHRDPGREFIRSLAACGVVVLAPAIVVGAIRPAFPVWVLACAVAGVAAGPVAMRPFMATRPGSATATVVVKVRFLAAPTLAAMAGLALAWTGALSPASPAAPLSGMVWHGVTYILVAIWSFAAAYLGLFAVPVLTLRTRMRRHRRSPGR